MRRERFGVYQKKSLGQVFLTTDWPVERMISKLSDWRVERVLEIGPGPGILTRGLVDARLKVTVVEKDDRFINKLEDQFRAALSLERFEIIHDDFLKMDLQDWISASQERTGIVGNIPYNISSPIVLRLLSMLDDLQGVVLMTQLEFAARLAARPNSKDYGSLSVFAQLRAQVLLEFKVDRSSFHPVPKVDSAVISLQPLRERLPDDVLQKVELVTRAAFMQRRKKLRNSIRQFLTAEKEAACPIDLDRRAESLSPRDFVDLTSYLLG